MSMDQPNEDEKAVENYASAVREERRTKVAAEKAAAEYVLARERRQELWRVVSGYVNTGKIETGIYRLKNSSNGVHAEAVLIEHHHDYPDIFPMFR